MSYIIHCGSVDKRHITGVNPHMMIKQEGLVHYYAIYGVLYGHAIHVMIE